jgi:arylsulfatase
MLRSLLALTSAFALGGATQAAEGSFEFDRTVLPITQEPFKGTIGTSIATSVPHRPEPVRAPEGAPNILVVMTDDVGFGTPSAFGGPVPTPNLDRLSADGFRFNRFHTTAVCSPTRAALLTGRNAHNAGTGELSDSGIPFPGYRGVIPRETATIARVLRDNGYNTAMFGKHHNLPGELQSAAGPFDSWPTGLGFEYFYGFLGGDVSQWEPRLYRHTSLANDAEWTGRHLDWRLASDAIRWVHNQKAAAPEKPFFMYYAPGTLHAPHHAPPEMIARFRGRFDKGWDVQREETHRRQLAAGIIPRGTALTPRPTAIPAWSSLSAQEKAYQAKLMEVAAATLAYQDEQFGRILAELERMGELDRTLVVFIEGDNGASGEATTVGTTNELGALLNGVVDTPASMSREIDRMGGPETYQNYSLGWAWAMNAPFKWAKQFPNFLGGTRNGMIMRWPAGTQARPGIRSQFSHVIDVAPTLLAAARLPAPQRVDGIQQKPLDGINLLRSVEGAPEIPRTQYFEMAGARAIYKNGWLANTTARRMPWQFTLPPEVAAEPQGWELYDLSKDFSQSRDLAVHYPSKLTELQRAFEEEAAQQRISDRRAFRQSSLGSGPKRPTRRSGRARVLERRR